MVWCLQNGEDSGDDVWEFSGNIGTGQQYVTQESNNPSISSNAPGTKIRQENGKTTSGGRLRPVDDHEFHPVQDLGPTDTIVFPDS